MAEEGDGCSKIWVLWKAASVKVYQSLPVQQRSLQKQWTALKVNRRTEPSEWLEVTSVCVLPGKWLPPLEFSSRSEHRMFVKGLPITWHDMLCIESQNDHRGQKWTEWRLVRCTWEPVLRCVTLWWFLQVKYNWLCTTESKLRAKNPSVLSNGRASCKRWANTWAPRRGKEGRCTWCPVLLHPMLCTPEASSVDVKS